MDAGAVLSQDSPVPVATPLTGCAAQRIPRRDLLRATTATGCLAWRWKDRHRFLGNKRLAATRNSRSSVVTLGREYADAGCWADGATQWFLCLWNRSNDSATPSTAGRPEGRGNTARAARSLQQDRRTPILAPSLLAVRARKRQELSFCTLQVTRQASLDHLESTVRRLGGARAPARVLAARCWPRRTDNASRIALVLLSQFVDWRKLLTIVQPDTLVRWHRDFFRLFCFKSRQCGRPRIPIGHVGMRVGIQRVRWVERKPSFGMALAIVVLSIEVLPRLVFLTSNSFQHERFLPYLWTYVARIPLLAALVLTGILLGKVIGQLAGSQLHKRIRK